MNKPHSIATVDCHTCVPWSRWVRSGSGAWVAQTRHEDHCGTYPHIQRAAHAAQKEKK